MTISKERLQLIWLGSTLGAGLLAVVGGVGWLPEILERFFRLAMVLLVVAGFGLVVRIHPAAITGDFVTRLRRWLPGHLEWRALLFLGIALVPVVLLVFFRRATVAPEEVLLALLLGIVCLGAVSWVRIGRPKNPLFELRALVLDLGTMFVAVLILVGLLMLLFGLAATAASFFTERASVTLSLMVFGGGVIILLMAVGWGFLMELWRESEE